MSQELAKQEGPNYAQILESEIDSIPGAKRIGTNLEFTT